MIVLGFLRLNLRLFLYEDQCPSIVHAPRLPRHPPGDGAGILACKLGSGLETSLGEGDRMREICLGAVQVVKALKELPTESAVEVRITGQQDAGRLQNWSPCGLSLD